MSSFYHELRSHGYTEEGANSLCISIENDLPVPKEVENLYWTWWNNKNIKKGENNETDYNSNR